MRSTLSCEGIPINGCQLPRLLNTRDCYVRTPMLLSSLVRPWIRPLSFLWEKVGPHMIARKYASRPDLRDQPILDPDLVLNTNGSSLVKQGQWLAGYAVAWKKPSWRLALCHHSGPLNRPNYMLQSRPSRCQKVRRQTFTQTPGMLLPHYRALYKERGLWQLVKKILKIRKKLRPY